MSQILVAPSHYLIQYLNTFSGLIPSAFIVGWFNEWPIEIIIGDIEVPDGNKSLPEFHYMHSPGVTFTNMDYL